MGAVKLVAAAACGIVVLALAACAPKATDPRARVVVDVVAFDRVVEEKRTAFARLSADPTDREWVKTKLAHMVEVDQYMRFRTMELPEERRYTDEERGYFRKLILYRWNAIDEGNTRDLKALLATHGWFKRREWGARADANAWLLVQHADRDRAFQRDVLAILETLVATGDTTPGNFAYLHDRVAVGEGRPQRYGSQGRCVGAGRWEPLPLEEPARVDDLRASVGLDPIAEYAKRAGEFCTEAYDFRTPPPGPAPSSRTAGTSG